MNHTLYSISREHNFYKITHLIFRTQFLPYIQLMTNASSPVMNNNGIPVANLSNSSITYIPPCNT